MKIVVSQLVGAGDLVLYAIIVGGYLVRGGLRGALVSLAVLAVLFIPTGIGILLKKKWGRALAMVAGVVFFFIMLASLITRTRIGIAWGQVILFLVLAGFHILVWRWMSAPASPQAVIAAAAAPSAGVRDKERRCPSCGSAVSDEEDIRFCHICGAPLVRKDSGAASADRGKIKSPEPEPDPGRRIDEPAPEQPGGPTRSRKALLGLGAGLVLVSAVLLIVLIRPGGHRSEDAAASPSTGDRSKLELFSRDVKAKEFRVGGEAASESAVTGMEFVWVPPGAFDMGSDEGPADQQPVRRVSLDGFWMGKYEVTQGQWKAVMGFNPSHFQGDDACPVEMVSWEDAQDFIRRLNDRTGLDFRLPSEAEWEYVCREGTDGDQEWSLSDFENSRFDAQGEIPPNAGGSSRPNAFGFFEIWGNVREWCQDWFGDYPSGNVRNPSGPSSGTHRSIRSHDWGPNGENKKIRASDRDYASPSTKDKHLGFRIVISE